MTPSKELITQIGPETPLTRSAAYSFRSIKQIPSAHVTSISKDRKTRALTIHGDGRRRLDSTEAGSETIPYSTNYKGRKAHSPRVESSFSFGTQSGDGFTSRISCPAFADIVVSYPLVQVGSTGIMSLLVSDEIVINITYDRAIQVVSHDNFSLFMNGNGTISALQHQRAQLVQNNEIMFAKFESSNDKYAMFDCENVLFSMSHLDECYLISNAKSAPVSVLLPPEAVFSKAIDEDHSVSLFYKSSSYGEKFVQTSCEIVRGASYERRADGKLCMNILGMKIIYTPDGELRIDSRPRFITCNPRTGCVTMRSPYIEIVLDADQKGHVKQDIKQMRVSRSGMVVSNGASISSMDHLGRIVTSSL